MREIKFRGLTVNGDMVHGSLSPDMPNTTAYYDECSQRICWFKDKGQHNIPVKNGTVGQFTGLKDKNGVEIYEGDVVTCDYDNCLVSYIKDFASFGLIKKGWLSIHYFGEAFSADESEVIGNIHENPELLGDNNE